MIAGKPPFGFHFIRRSGICLLKGAVEICTGSTERIFPYEIPRQKVTGYEQKGNEENGKKTAEHDKIFTDTRDNVNTFKFKTNLAIDKMPGLKKKPGRFALPRAFASTVKDLLPTTYIFIYYP